MNGRCPSPQDLAIWVDEGRAPGVSDSHIAGCVSCGEFAEALRADQAMLKRLEELPEPAYTQVRARVLERLSGGKPTLRYYWAAAAIAAAVLIATFLPRTRAGVAPAPRLAPRVAELKTPSPPLREEVKRAPVRRRQPARKATGAELIAALDAFYELPIVPAVGAPGQTVITLQTGDPNVTIMLLGESTGDDE